MATYIDTTYVDAFVGTSTRQALFNDGSGYVSANFDQAVTTASERIRVAAKAAGYTLSTTTTTDEFVKEAAFGQWLLLAYGRKGLSVPEQFATSINLLEAIRTGTAPILGSTPDNLYAVGAAEFTSSDATDTTGVAAGDTRPQIFRTLGVVW